MKKQTPDPSVLYGKTWYHDNGHILIFGIRPLSSMYWLDTLQRMHVQAEKQSDQIYLSTFFLMTSDGYMRHEWVLVPASRLIDHRDLVDTAECTHEIVAGAQL